MTVLERFEAKFIPEPNSGCYLWTAAVNSGGYGHFGVAGKVLEAHRVAYSLYVAGIPSGISVLHKCDVKSCVRPDHLFLGTQMENLKDMTDKGRRKYAHGENSGAAKLKYAQVAAIRADCRSSRAMAKDYEVGKSTIAAIKSGAAWRTA